MKLIGLIQNSKVLIVLALSFFLVSFNIELKERKVLNGKMSLLLPLDFIQMDESTLLVKYPSVGNRPNEVYTNEKGSVNIAFNHTLNTINESELLQVQIAIQQQLSNTKGIEILKTTELKINSADFITIEFMSNAIDTKIFNLMFITTLEDKLLLGSFNCTINEYAEWQPISKKIINSIRK